MDGFSIVVLLWRLFFDQDHVAPKWEVLTLAVVVTSWLIIAKVPLGWAVSIGMAFPLAGWLLFKAFSGRTQSAPLSLDPRNYKRPARPIAERK